MSREYFNQAQLDQRIAAGMNPNYAEDPWYVPSPGYGEAIHPVLNQIHFIINSKKGDTTTNPKRFPKYDDVINNLEIDFRTWQRICKMQLFPDGKTMNRITITAAALGYEEKKVEKKSERENVVSCPPEIKKQMEKDWIGMKYLKK